MTNSCYAGSYGENIINLPQYEYHYYIKNGNNKETIVSGWFNKHAFK